MKYIKRGRKSMKNGHVLRELIRRFLGKRAVLYFGEILVIGVASGILEISIAKIMGNFTDLAAVNAEYNFWSENGIYFFAVLLAIMVNVTANVLYNNEAKRIGNVINNTVYMKTLRLPMEFYDTHHTGEYMSRIIWDTGRMTDVFGSVLRRIIMPFIIVVVCIVPMFLMCPPVMLGLFGISVLSLGLNALTLKPGKKLGGKVSEETQNIIKALTNMIQGMETIKLYPVKRPLLDSYEDANKSCAKYMLKQGGIEAFVAGLRAAFDLIGSLAFLALGLLYIEKTNGKIGNLISLYLLYGTFHFHFLQLGVYMSGLADCLVNGERVLEFLRQPEEQGMEVTGERKVNLEYDPLIEICNISYGYKNKKRKVFDEYSVSFKKGLCYAITGESGRGKSTLGKLLLGFYEPEYGSIYIGGTDLRELGLNRVREQISYVPQEPYLFNVSIRENIRYGKLDASDEEIVEAAKLANAHAFIMRLEKGYDTIVEERGNNFSGGQRQRIAIARALLRDAPIFLMDEATSALDNETEKFIQDSINSIKRDRTILMIAHRPGTAAMADKVIVI